MANKSRNKSDQSMMSHWGESAKDKPFTTAAAAAGAVAAGVFLWSKRNQISDQISRLSDQITDWAGEMRSSNSAGSSRELAMTEGPNESSAIEASRATASRRGTGNSGGKAARKSSGTNRGMSATGGGNASLGAHSGTTGTGAGGSV